MTPRRAVSAGPFDLLGVTPSEWEEATFYLAEHHEDERVVRLRAPDGGADVLLPTRGEDGRRSRAWQAKHHTSGIDWGDCEKSLDRLRTFWNPRRVTFVFPRDLTGLEHATFEERLGARHADTEVDYWAEGKISSLLLADDHGERIAQRFFGREDPIAIMERALRAGGEMSTGAHALDRLEAVESFLRSDPGSRWVAHTRKFDEGPPPRSPGAVVRFELRRGSSIVALDLVPEADGRGVALLPRVRLKTDDSPGGQQARGLLARLERTGGRARLREGVRLEVDDVPAPFAELLSEPMVGPMTVRLVPDAEPYVARLSADTDLGLGEVEVALVPVEADSDWDVSFHGEHAGLELDVRSRYEVVSETQETSVAFRFRPGVSRATLAERARVATFVVAAHGEGTVALSGQGRSPVRQSVERRALAEDVMETSRLLAALSAIERSTGLPAPVIPEEIVHGDVDLLVSVAAALEAGAEPMPVPTVSMVASDAALAELRAGEGKPITLCDSAFVEALGAVIPFARRTITLPAIEVISAEPTGQAGHWTVKVRPSEADVVEVLARYEPFDEQHRAQWLAGEAEREGSSPSA